MHRLEIRRYSLGLLLLCAFPLSAEIPGRDGAAVYAEHCARCHDGGLSGLMVRAPRLGSAYWSEREATIGREQLVIHSLQGYGRMAAQGGPDGVSEGEARAAVSHLLEAAKP